MTPQLAQALGSAALLGAIVRPLLAVTILFGLWLARASGNHVSTPFDGLDDRRSVVNRLDDNRMDARSAGVLAQTPGASQFYSAEMIVAPSMAAVVVALALLVRSSTITAAITTRRHSGG